MIKDIMADLQLLSIFLLFVSCAIDIGL